MKKETKRVSLILLLATAVSLIGYPNPANAATFNVTVGVQTVPGSFVFNPRSVTIHPGDQVKWTWASSGHTTTSGPMGTPDGIWNSGLRNQGATFTHTFNGPSAFPYYCTQHIGVPPFEGGQVIVITPGRATVADFNGDGHPDFVVQNLNTQPSTPNKP